ncbi:MAG: tetratricopeptide repeat protein [Deltaproteobacteria bacterium]|nr:tetratricopeptide repeat protein [Deltaproteobacteria bacterium]
MRATILVCFVTGLFALPATGRAELNKAKDRYKDGKALFEAGKIEEALAAFTDSYNASGNPDLLFNLGVCSERLGRKDKAVAYYELYLEEKPDAPDAADVRARVAALKAPPPRPVEPTTEAANPPAPARPELVVAPVEEDDTGVPWPAVTVGAGALVLASGALTAILAYREYDFLKRECAPGCSDGRVEKARDMALAADIQFAVGGAAVVVGAVLWLTRDKGRGDVAGVSVRPVPGGSGGPGLAMAGRF